MVSQNGVIKILDFGLAKSWLPESESTVRSNSLGAPLTGRYDVVGTIPYMSPEQAVGQPVGPRSDVFSTGIVLYEMLSGCRPFQGSSNSEVMRALLSSEPPPLLSMTEDLSEPLARITHQCLQKSPDARYRDGIEVAAQLRALDRSSWPHSLFDASTVAMAVQKPVPRPIQKQRRVLASGVVLLLLAVGLLAQYLWWSSRKNAGLSPSTVVALGPAEALERARAYLQRYDRKGNVDRAIAALEPSLQREGSNAALHAALAEAYVRKYDETASKQWLQTAIASGRKAVAVNQDLAAGHVALAMALAANGQSDEAAAHFEEARDLNPLSGPAHVGLARLRSARVAEQLYLKAVQCSPGEWAPLHELAAFYQRDARYEESIATWKQALQLAPDNVPVMVYLAAGFHMNGQYAEAADTLQRALALDATNASGWANLGTARYFQQRYLDAVRATEKAVGLAPGRYMYWGNLGDIYRRAEGLENKAAGAYQKAIALVRERLAATPDDRLRSSLAVYLAKGGDTAGALAELAQLRQIRPSDKGTLFKTALVYELAHDRDKALAALGRAIRAGYSMHEVANEPEFAALRSDPRFASIARASARKKK
jgi:tetratricopeptide (TPR) repeat protein